MAGLLERLMLGPRVGRRRVGEARSVDSLAAILEAARGPRSHAGVPVDDEQAMRLGAVWACVDLLSEIVATLPVDELRRDVNGMTAPLVGSQFIADPAGDGTGFEVWCRQVMTALLLRGNAYGFINDLGTDMWPSRIEVLHPDRVTVRRQTTFGPVEWLLDRKPVERWPAGPLWHLSAYNVPGTPIGMSPIRYAAETIGLGVATRKFGAQWFGDGAHPTSTLESDQPIDGAMAELVKQRVVDALYDSRGPLVLGAGLKLNAVQIAPEESQFLETTQANVADVARYFRVPPEMIGGESGSSMTYATLEGRSLHLLTYSVNPWLVRIERALSRLRPRPRLIKFNSDALVRVDLANRYRAHDMAIRSGWKSRNEVRRIEDYPPIPDGDEYLWPPYSTAPVDEEPVVAPSTNGDTAGAVPRS